MIENTQNRVRFTTLAMLTAISCALVFLYVPFPLFPAFKYELADVPILIATFSFGPVAGILVVLVAAFVQAFILGHDQLMGFVMHILATGTFAIVSGVIYHRNKTKRTAAIGLICGTLAMAAVMCLANYILDPIFYGMTKEAVAKLILPAILPFNLTKAGINAIVTFLIYKKISNIIHKNTTRV
ncbi:MAG: ECF transporter S component [Hornefia sp.]|nr:ECF transporter S component [Hornefia sp.]